MVTVVAAVVIVVLTVFAGIMSNWFRRPPTLTDRRLVGMLVLVVAAIAVLTLWKESSGDEQTPAEEAATQVEQAPTTATRPLRTWVTEVNETCAPANAEVDAERAKYESAGDSLSTEESIESMRALRKVLGPLVRDLNQVALPSRAAEKDKANDWLTAYNEFYAEFVTFIEKLDGATSGGLLEEIVGYPGTRDAYQGVMDAFATVKSTGDVLGIECPGSDVTR